MSTLSRTATTLVTLLFLLLGVPYLVSAAQEVPDQDLQQVIKILRQAEREATGDRQFARQTREAREAVERATGLRRQGKQVDSANQLSAARKLLVELRNAWFYRTVLPALQLLDGPAFQAAMKDRRWSDFLVRYPGSPFATEARARMVLDRSQDAHDTGTREGYEAFFAWLDERRNDEDRGFWFLSFPETPIEKEASAATARLREDLAWVRATSEDSADAYLRFLAYNRSSPRAEDARSKIAGKEEEEWKRARDSGTVESLARFAVRYPTSRNLSDIHPLVSDSISSGRLVGHSVVPVDTIIQQSNVIPLEGRLEIKSTFDPRTGKLQQSQSAVDIVAFLPFAQIATASGAELRVECAEPLLFNKLQRGGGVEFHYQSGSGLLRYRTANGETSYFVFGELAALLLRTPPR